MVASDSDKNRVKPSDDVITPRDGAVYVRLNGRLAQFKRPPTREYWEEHWGGLSDDEVSYVLRRSASLAGQASFIRRHIPARSTVLEAGCGVGLWVRRLQENGINAIGLDYARATLVRSKRVASDLPFVAGDLRNLPFPDETLDVHLSFGVIEHYVDGPGPLLEEALRVLRPGGRLLASVPHVNVMRKCVASYQQEAVEAQGYRFHQYYYEWEELKDLLAEAGFEPADEIHCYSAYNGLCESSRLFRKTIGSIPGISRAGLLLDFVPGLSRRFGHMMFVVGTKR